MFLPEGEFALEESSLHRVGFGAGAVDGGGLEAGEGDFIDEVFAAGGAGGFPGDEDMGRDEAAYGGGGVAEEGCGFGYSDAFGRGEHGERRGGGRRRRGSGGIGVPGFGGTGRRFGFAAGRV